MKQKHLPLNLLSDDSIGTYITQESFWELVPPTLTAEEKRVIALRLEGNNFKEISSELDVNRSSVKRLFNSAIKKIRDNNDE